MRILCNPLSTKYKDVFAYVVGIYLKRVEVLTKNNWPQLDILHIYRAKSGRTSVILLVKIHVVVSCRCFD